MQARKPASVTFIEAVLISGVLRRSNKLGVLVIMEEGDDKTRYPQLISIRPPSEILRSTHAVGRISIMDNASTEDEWRKKRKERERNWITVWQPARTARWTPEELHEARSVTSVHDSRPPPLIKPLMFLRFGENDWTHSP